jgi:hypothetical protein
MDEMEFLPANMMFLMPNNTNQESNIHEVVAAAIWNRYAFSYIELIWGLMKGCKFNIGFNIANEAYI